MMMRRIRLALGGLLFMGALFVILPGLGRLVAAQPPQEERSQVLKMCSAILTGATRQTEETANNQKSDTRVHAFAKTDSVLKALPVSGTLRDANGNVLTARAYYQCVPEAFAPGDAKT